MPKFENSCNNGVGVTPDITFITLPSDPGFKWANSRDYPDELAGYSNSLWKHSLLQSQH